MGIGVGFGVRVFSRKCARAAELDTPEMASKGHDDHALSSHI